MVLGLQQVDGQSRLELLTPVLIAKSDYVTVLLHPRRLMIPHVKLSEFPSTVQ